MIVNGPGQNFSINLCATCDSTIAISSSAFPLGRCTMSGSKRGRSFASKILVTASGLSASGRQLRKPFRSGARPLLRPAKAGSLSRTHARKRFPSSLRQFRRRAPLQSAFCETPEDFRRSFFVGKCENSCSQKSARISSRPRSQWRVYQRECLPAFAAIERSESKPCKADD